MARIKNSRRLKELKLSYRDVIDEEYYFKSDEFN